MSSGESEHSRFEGRPRSLSEHEALEIGVEAYHYLFPLVLMDVTRRAMVCTNEEMAPGTGPSNAFHHYRAFPAAGAREVVRPSFDTLYSSAWLDLTEGPVTVSIQDTGHRFFMLPFMDMWSDVIATPSRRTVGPGGGRWLVVPPRWSGPLPDGMPRIHATTPYLWIIGRTQTDGPQDYQAVHLVQDGYEVIPAAVSGGNVSDAVTIAAPPIDAARPPIAQVASMSPHDFFTYGAELMKVNPPHATDWSQLRRMERLGIQGNDKDPAVSPHLLTAIMEKAATTGLKVMKARSGTLAPLVNGWQTLSGPLGVYGNDYAKRAIMAMIALGTCPPEDAVYPLCVLDSNKEPPDGSKAYLLRFPKGRLPPVGAFWSLTLYDQDGFPVINPLGRYTLGNRDAMRLDHDGSLSIYVQSHAPEADLLTNWLPSPASGRFSLTMRLYEPKPSVLDGRWTPPPLVQVEEANMPHPGGDAGSSP